MAETEPGPTGAKGDDATHAGEAERTAPPHVEEAPGTESKPASEDHKEPRASAGKAESSRQDSPAPQTFPLGRLSVLLKPVGFAVLAILIVFAASAIVTSGFWQSIFRGSDTAANPYNIAPGAMREYSSATGDHENIALAIAACSGILNLVDQPDYIRAELRLDVAPDGRRFGPLPNAPVKTATNELKLSNFHRAAIYLSDAIVRARTEAASNAGNNYSSMVWFQLAIVGIGAITTILISIKSISSPGSNPRTERLYFGIGIAAIVFSSVGTATSALNAFYAPRESYLRADRSLSGLRQLHADIATRVTSSVGEPCPTIDATKANDTYQKQVQDWLTRFGSIVNASETSGASAQTSSGGGQNQTGAGGGSGRAPPQAPPP